MLSSADKEILLLLTLSGWRGDTTRQSLLVFFSPERGKKLQQLHYLGVNNSKLGTHFCTAHCLQTESIHRDRLSLSRIKAGWAVAHILSPATKPGTHPSRVSPSPLLIKSRSYRATSQPPSFLGEPARVQHQPHTDFPALEPAWEMQGQQAPGTALLWAAPLTSPHLWRRKKQKQTGKPSEKTQPEQLYKRQSLRDRPSTVQQPQRTRAVLRHRGLLSREPAVGGNCNSALSLWAAAVLLPQSSRDPTALLVRMHCNKQ